MPHKERARAEAAKLDTGKGANHNGSIVPKLWLDVLTEDIPEAMRNEHRWVVWKEVGEDKRKVPYQGHYHTRKASSTNQITWCTFEIARQVYEAGVCSGIGFALGDGWAGIDLDKCLDGEDLHPEAASILQDLDTYAEVSPSGTGVKAFIRYQGAPTKGIQGNPVGFERIELYNTGRYFTVTGHRLDDYGDEVQERTSHFDALVRRYGSTPSSATNREYAETNGKIARNDTLCRMAGAARANGADVDTVREMVLGANDRIPEAHGGPLEISELESTVFKSATQWPQGDATLEAKAFEAPQLADLTVFREDPKPQQWAFTHIPHAEVCGLDGAGGLGKSSLVLGLVVAAAISRPMVQAPIFPSLQPMCAKRVLWLSAEDSIDEIHRRLREYEHAYQITAEERERIITNLDIVTGSWPLVAVQAGTLLPTKAFEWLKGLVAERKPDLLVIDPRSQFFAGDENDNTLATRFFALLREMCTAHDGGCTVLATHHVSKANQNNSDSASGRGASAARDALRCVLTLTPVPPEKVADIGGSNPHNFMQMEVTKSNRGPRTAAPIVFQKVGRALVEVDAAALKAEVTAGKQTHIIKTLVAELKELGNSHMLTKASIMREAADIRERIRDMHACKDKDIRAALTAAIEAGTIIEVEAESAKPGKAAKVLRVPEAAEW